MHWDGSCKWLFIFHSIGLGAVYGLASYMLSVSEEISKFHMCSSADSLLSVVELGTIEKLHGIEELIKFHVCIKSHRSMYGQDILCGISKVTFEISHKNFLPTHSNMWISYMDQILHLQPYAHQHFDTNFLYLIKAYWYLFMLILIHICLSGCPYIASQSLFKVRKFIQLVIIVNKLFNCSSLEINVLRFSHRHLKNDLAITRTRLVFLWFCWYQAWSYAEVLLVLHIFYQSMSEDW